jgi:hypothetical protein
VTLDCSYRQLQCALHSTVPQNPQVVIIIALLEQEYGSPRHGNPSDPLDELIYIKLSQQTNSSWTLYGLPAASRSSVIRPVAPRQIGRD